MTPDTKEKPSQSYFSLISIIIVDVVLIGIALKTGLSITQLIWLYWCEGVIIGILQSFKVFATEVTTISFLEHLAPNTPPMCLTILFFALQIPFHCFFAFWIYHIDPTFDYVHGLLVMAGIILIHEIFCYLRNSRPWSEPDDIKNVIVESGTYFLRFLPVIALFYLMIKTQAGKGNKTLLTAGFMSFKLLSDVVSHFIGIHLFKNPERLEGHYL